MSRTIIDIAITLILFTGGMGWTVFRYCKRDRFVFTVVAILSPAIAIFSVFSLLYLVMKGKVELGPCPSGLVDAERLVEQERQRMFGGELREPTFAIAWQRAYEIELQREAEGVKRLAQRVFANA